MSITQILKGVTRAGDVAEVAGMAVAPTVEALGAFAGQQAVQKAGLNVAEGLTDERNEITPRRRRKQEIDQDSGLSIGF